MAIVIDIHTGEEKDIERVPQTECSVCESYFSIDDEGGITGYFGILMVAFCPFCFSSMIDMVKHIIDDEK